MTHVFHWSCSCKYDMVGSKVRGAQHRCERDQGCCEHGCCPKDQHWMAGVYVLLAFVLLVFIVGTVLMIVCYQRSKNKQRKEQRQAMEYSGYAASQVGVPGAYSSYGGPTY
ncbi:hypothetical protein RB195_014905 [Necator americanus]|uniref:Uncharacterized protein n=2 Tax=Necator americanus TaxID=51031 RepID=A0ABR1E252_NECAM